MSVWRCGVWGRCVEMWRCVEVCGGVWRCGVCEGELSAQVGCISRKGEI